MPIINLKISNNNPDLIKKLSHLITEITVKILKKKVEVTAITFQYIHPNEWFIGNKSLSELNQNSFYLDIKITDGTNHKNEKRDFIEQIFSLMALHLPNLHHESYVYVEEVKADAYGFGGKTQEFRYIENK